MSKITVEKNFSNLWGDCIKVSNGETEFVATVEMGPRIIRFGKVGGPNELFEDPAKEAFVEHEELEKFWGNRRYYNMGGHRLWHSPEDMPKTYLNNYAPITYEILSNGVKIESEYKEISLKNTIIATMSDDGELNVKHYVTNIGSKKVELAPWAITILALGGLEVIPTSQRETGFLSNRSLMIWPYADVKDKRFNMSNKYICMTTDDKGDTENVNAFKIGINNVDGYAMYFNHNNLFIKRFEYEENGNYPDNGCNFETYTNFRLMEMESLGKIQEINPGESVTHTEIWNLYTDVKMPETEEEIDMIVEKYINKKV